jgi:sulfate adenylyltransferase subunit 2
MSDTTTYTLDHLDVLESEAVHVFREVVGEFDRPALLFSGGKDSVVMLHLAVKAFAPSPVPFPVVHVDTGHNFPEVIAYRDETVERVGVRLVVAHVQDWIDDGRLRERPDGTRNPLQTVPLLETIVANKFDAVFGGGRRDEEKARAKERVFSLRDEFGQWDPRRQRPELWDVYNGRHRPGEHVRVFPLSNWTELDVWQYIHLENIPIVPLYFAAERPVIERSGTLIMVDDDRLKLSPSEKVELRKVRFRTLGCYPLSGAIESTADTLPGIIQEMLLTRFSERQGRLIDSDQAGSMEKKKKEGYF